ncbi:hypothetical protein BDW62DRAFT_48638 [Aspergillus aurantiobrunneus]
MVLLCSRDKGCVQADIMNAPTVTAAQTTKTAQLTDVATSLMSAAAPTAATAPTKYAVGLAEHSVRLDTAACRRGLDSCYDPDVEVCCPEDETTCDTGYTCVTDGCCRDGHQECGADKCYDPEDQICCTAGNSAWSCPLAERCCSASQSCYDPDTEQCCDIGACDESGSCCENECCDEDERYGGNGYCTATTTIRSTSSTRDEISFPTYSEDGGSSSNDEEIVITTDSLGETATITIPVLITPTDTATREMLVTWQLALPIVAMLWRLI